MSGWWGIAVLAVVDAVLWVIVHRDARVSGADRRLLVHAGRRGSARPPRPSVWERVGAPALRSVAACLRPFASPVRRGRIVDHLMLAGLEWDPALFDGLRIAGAASGIGAVALVGSRLALPGGSSGWMALGAALGSLAPGTWVRSRGGSRAREFQKALPDALDVLAICLGAGLGLQAAVAECARNCSGVAGEAFRRYLADLALGRTPEDGLAELARRYPGDDLAVVASGLTQSIRLGSPVAATLGEQAAHFRALALRRAEEGARGLSTRLVLPLVAFVFPNVFIIGLGPIALRLFGPGGLLR